MPTPDDLLTTAEVAAMFRVNTNTVARWGRNGILPRIKQGGAVRFRRSEIEAILLPDPTPSAA